CRAFSVRHADPRSRRRPPGQTRPTRVTGNPTLRTTASGTSHVHQTVY
ncbi:MAG: hypothetical protein AVDCRST_MAG49-3605, partial [uncultured Thermomicrobiales bacterium]